jgi:hypothetical protein
MLKIYKRHFRVLLRGYMELLGPQESVLDCGSAHGKFRNYFNTKQYVGLDIQKFVPIPGVKYQLTDKFLELDLTSSDFPKLDTFSLVVCTHTIENLAANGKIKALRNMTSVMNKDSLLMIHLLQRDFRVLEDYLNADFELLSQVKYRGFLSIISFVMMLNLKSIGFSRPKGQIAKSGRFDFHQEYILVLRRKPQE